MEKRQINPDFVPMTSGGKSLRINDIGFRLILAPAFGIVIPLVTGMINLSNLSNLHIKLSFLYTILTAVVIWEGNRYLHFSLRSYFDWYNKPLRKILVVLLSISFYTIPIAVLLISGWYKLFTSDPPDRQVITVSTLIIMICVIFITHVYETVFLVKESENEMVRNEQLERARAEAELEALKNQIDPHFIFNSLNTLSHLIEDKPHKAKMFNDHLADVYRYILQNKAKELVLLKEELDFMNDYFSLLKIRFENAVKLEINIPEQAYHEYLVPPICLQLLIENAIKHNEFSDANPLVIKASVHNEVIVVSNNMQRKELFRESSKIGLNNLKERYRLTTGKEITITKTRTIFEVTLPLIAIHS
ncbi:MAG: sensor histidine kinase [Agriterribacter sp.]